MKLNTGDRCSTVQYSTVQYSTVQYSTESQYPEYCSQSPSRQVRAQPDLRRLQPGGARSHLLETQWKGDATAS